MVTPQQLEDWDRRLVWHAFTQMAEYEPLIIERAEGCVLQDIHGRRYLDGVSSLWCNVHGHRHPHIDAAIRRQLDQVAHVTSLGQGNVPATLLARQLVDRAPAGLEHVFYSSDGASAVEVALKMAFQYWRQRSAPQPARSRFVALHEAYHGDTLGSVSVGGVDRFHSLFRPLLFDVLRAPAPDLYRLPTGVSVEQARDYYLDRLAEVLEQHAEEIAAVVLEPLVQGAAGMLVHPRGYLRGVRELTQRYGVLLIADEVAVGLGRTGTIFACQQEQITPDLLCLGKGLTGGYLPMSATLATDEIWQAFLGRHDQWRQLSHGHTYSGNPLAAAAALATFEVFDEQRVLEQLPAKIERLAAHLQRIAQQPFVGHVRQCGLIGAVELVEDRATRRPFPPEQRRGHSVCRHALNEGVWLRPLGDVIVIMPPLSITLEQLDQICVAVENGIAKQEL